MAELLFEIGSEELPARFVVPALSELERLFTEQCAQVSLTHGAIRTFGTPRRLALAVSQVLERTPDVTKEVLGPSVRAAFDAAGKPTKPAEKFAESVKLPVDQLLRLTTPKGEYVGARVEEKGKRALELLPGILDGCVRKLIFPKSMRWGDVELAFGRPLHWIVALLDGEVVPVTYADVRSGRVTRGHRFLAPGPITLERPQDYEAKLEAAQVIVSIPKRRQLVVDRVRAAATKAQGQLREDDELVDQVTNLVELPCPVVGTFEARHLELPPEVLVSEMKSHQRYFSLQGADGKILPKFIAVSNTPVRDEALSVRGYERVLRARLSDGRFFFDEDRRTKLVERVTRLHRRTWVATLGNMAEKTDRIRSLALSLAQLTSRGSKGTLERAATLCKADLETGMVGEFPELQGVMGREYARHDGEPEDVSLAVFEHYLPRNAQDTLPTRDDGAILGLADRFDSIVGLFSIGKKPTGAKDDFQQRRQCLAIINLTLSKGYRYSLAAVIDEASRLFEAKLAELKKKDSAPVKPQVLDFFRGRLENLWREQHRADLVDAVLAAGFDDLVQAQKRLEALSHAAGRPDFSQLAATFKRVGNIVEKQAKDVAPGPVVAALLTDPAEQALDAELRRVKAEALPAARRDDYGAAMVAIVAIKPAVDTFFDKVMVMDKEPAVRENRVRLLMEIGAVFGTVADFSKIQAES